MSADAGRHISVETLNEYLHAGNRASIPVAGEPSVLLTIDGADETLTLECEWDGEAVPAIADYVHITSDTAHREGHNWARLTVHGARFFEEGYPLLRAVADGVQLDSETFAGAVERSLSTYHDLLAATAHMSVAEEVGLFGELVVLSRLIDAIGPTQALAAWRGDAAEEHDFGLVSADVEVKTTTAEVRRHWISTLTQLQPTVGRPLFLVSIQLTGAGAGDGQRLPDLIASVESRIPPTDLTGFRERLKEARVRAGQPIDTFRLLRLRSRPACFAVQGDFPRLVPELLARGGADLARIEQVTYVVGLDSVTPTTTPPAELTGLLTEEHE